MKGPGHWLLCCHQKAGTVLTWGGGGERQRLTKIDSENDRDNEGGQEKEGKDSE